MTFFGVFASVASAQWNTVPPDAVVPDWRSEVPIAVHPDTSLVNLYERAWEIASGRVRRGQGMVASPYLDENCYDDQIWIWDGCFMVMFSKYAPNAFPGKETLMNYYAPIHDGAPSPLRIHLRDNPPLFAWVEKENYLFTGDTAQIDMVVATNAICRSTTTISTRSSAASATTSFRRSRSESPCAATLSERS